jgi:hypothetical protein
MFNSYFKTAFRFLPKNKGFSFINIFGLGAGTLCCLYIVLYVSEEHSYDIPISWWMFGLGGLAAIIIAVFTISFQAIKAAIGNPVKSLNTQLYFINF